MSTATREVQRVPDFITPKVPAAAEPAAQGKKRAGLTDTELGPSRRGLLNLASSLGVPPTPHCSHRAPSSDSLNVAIASPFPPFYCKALCPPSGVNDFWPVRCLFFSRLALRPDTTCRSLLFCFLRLEFPSLRILLIQTSSVLLVAGAADLDPPTFRDTCCLDRGSAGASLHCDLPLSV